MRSIYPSYLQLILLTVLQDPDKDYPIVKPLGQVIHVQTHTREDADR